MTNEQVNIAIAEACGWKFVKNDPDYEPYWEDPSGYKIAVGLHKRRIPDYCRDLNAMHEAEKTLDQMQARLYADYLAESEQDGTWASCHMWHQSAAQRAEAFLKTIGKWEE